MSEKPMDALDLIKVLKEETKDVEAGSGNFANFLYFNTKKGETEKKIRFITDLQDAGIIKFHQKRVWQGETEYSHPVRTFSTSADTLPVSIEHTPDFLKRYRSDMQTPARLYRWTASCLSILLLPWLPSPLLAAHLPA